jgi:hypothetical protein
LPQDATYTTGRTLASLTSKIAGAVRHVHARLHDVHRLDSRSRSQSDSAERGITL